jgi:glutathione S-transferase
MRRESLGDGMLDTLLMWRGEVTRPPEQQSIKHMQAWRLKTNVSVDALEEEADALAKSGFSIGHIALGVALGYIDFRFPELNWREGHPKIAAWHAAFETRPSAKANTPVDEP